MKKTIFVIVIALLVSWTVFDLVLSKDKESSKEVEVSKEVESTTENPEAPEIGIAIGNEAPDFKLTTLEGEEVNLSDYRGKRVFINFWATWCPPCRAEMPDMQKLYEEDKLDIEILAINITESEPSEENVEQFVKDFGLTFPILMDRNTEVASNYRVQAYPTSYMVDSKGIIRFVAPGAMNHDLMVQLIEDME